MGVFDKFIKLELKSTEAKAIVDMIRENDLRGRKVYFDNLFYHAAVEKDGEMDYIRKDILYVTLPNDGYFYTDLIFSIGDEEFDTIGVDMQVVTLVYIKLQDYVRDFNSENVSN